jgi:hypothetical protein
MRAQPTGSILKPCRIRTEACILDDRGKVVRRAVKPAALSVEDLSSRAAIIGAEVKG